MQSIRYMDASDIFSSTAVQCHSTSSPTHFPRPFPMAVTISHSQEGAIRMSEGRLRHGTIAYLAFDVRRRRGGSTLVTSLAAPSFS